MFSPPNNTIYIVLFYHFIRWNNTDFESNFDNAILKLILNMYTLFYYNCYI
jgi:hypothetical protein